MKFAILFSGQGAQKTGMGLDFLEDETFKTVLDTSSRATQKDLISIFESKKDELKKTVNVQPALVAFESGIYQMLKRDIKLNVSGMIGLSLGEYSAMAASGALSLTDTISLVNDRARYMQEDSDKVDSGMAALVKPNIAEIEKLIAILQQQGLKVYLANYNSSKQVVIGGIKEDVAKAANQIKEKSLAKKAIILRVNGAFHTPLFNSASKKMHNRLQDVTFAKNNIPVISNTTGVPFSNNWAKIMERQLAEPTHFDECLKWLIDHQEVDATLEIGPGKTLTAFAKQVDRSLKNYQVGTLEEYRKFIEEINEN